jgi:hypothetical protein
MLSRLLKTQPHPIDLESDNNSTGSAIQKVCRPIELASCELIGSNSIILWHTLSQAQDVIALFNPEFSLESSTQVCSLKIFDA